MELIKDGEQSGDDMVSGNGYYKVDDERFLICYVGYFRIFL